MSKTTVQCKGSGRLAGSGFAKRAACPTCGRMQDRASNGRIRKHTRILSKSQLRKIR